jgi:hypothetical protein
LIGPSGLGDVLRGATPVKKCAAQAEKAQPTQGNRETLGKLGIGPTPAGIGSP